MLNVNPMPQPDVNTRFFGCTKAVPSSIATAPLSASTSKARMSSKPLMMPSKHRKPITR